MALQNKYHLVARSGTNRGKCWPIGEKPLVIGRGEGCDIVISDRMVSRRHCEVIQTEDGLQIRDLGSVNATLVNGRFTVDGKVKEGDEITLGGVVFVIARWAPPGKAHTDEPQTATSYWETLEQVYRSNEEQGRSIREMLPHGASELIELFELNRQAGNATTVAELLDILALHIRKQFSPDEFWLAWYLSNERRLVLNAIDGVTALPDEAPLEAMEKAAESGEGALISGGKRGAKSKSLATLLIAPLSAAGEKLGTIAIRKSVPGTIYSGMDMQYFAAMAHIVAPHLRAAARSEQLHRDIQQAQRLAGLSPTLLGDSKCMVAVRKLISQAASSHLNVLILGETGTGKELAARMIHDLSDRSMHPFVVLNCAAIPRELFASELFGHEKDAYTGSASKRTGFFEEAHCGTLFLDEIGDLAPDNQALILRTIESGTFYRVGSSKEMKVDVRIVAATNRIQGRPSPGSPFRADLYHRLSGFEVHMPTLREHIEDLPVLVDHFIDEVRQKFGLAVTGVSAAGLERMRAWTWPGNVRELRSCLHRGTALARTGSIELEHLYLSTSANPDSTEENTNLTLAEAEKRHIAFVLGQLNGNIRAAARALEISRDTLYNKIRSYGINT